MEKNKKTAFRTHPWIPKKRNLVDKVVLPLVAAFSRPGGSKNGLARPASTREKLTRIFFQNHGRDPPRAPYIYVWASPAFPSPRCLVVLLSFGLPFGVVGRSSRYRVHRGNLFAGVGRLGSQILIFGHGFSVNLKDLSFLGYLGLSLLLVSAGWSLPSGSPGCGLSVGARRGRLLLGSLRLDDVGRKNCV